MQLFGFRRVTRKISHGAIFREIRCSISLRSQSVWHRSALESATRESGSSNAPEPGPKFKLQLTSSSFSVASYARPCLRDISGSDDSGGPTYMCCTGESD
jgi:hypothetical protein